MLYRKTEYNILHLLNIAGVLYREQLVMFFTDADFSSERVEYILKKLSDKNYIRYDAKNDTYESVNAPDVSDEIKEKRLEAFWVIANTKNTEVLQIMKTEYPGQFLFITRSNIVYDITVCYSENDAANARLLWMKYTDPDIKDSVIHVAVVIDSDLGKRLGKYGFDCFCMIDKTTFNALYEVYR